MVLQAIRYQRGHLEILDQLQLPHRTVYEEVKTRRDAWDAIRKMRVRGAPAIAIVAVLAVAVEVDALLQAAAPPPPLPSPTAHLQASPSSAEPPPPSASTVHDFICESLDYLLSSRPTAVNLADAVAKLKALLHDVRSRATRAEAPLSGADVANAYIAAAERMLDDDVRDNEAIGRHGAEWIRKHVAAASATGTSQEAAGVRVVTHCNTGSLATAGYGTALGVIRALHASSVLERAYCTETRPYNQGTRLTAFELVHDGIPATLIADCMAAALFRSLGSGDGVHAVVAGAAGAAGAVGATGATGAADAMEQQRQREEQKDQQELRVGDSSGGGDGSANSSNSKYGRAAPAAEPAPAPMASPASPAVVIVGADRVAANGDTANKIGTYALAILARHHGLKFLVAAPRTTIDRRTPSGAHIVIEERPGEELARVSGAVYRRRPDPAGDPADGNSIMVGREHGEAGNEEGGEGEGDARARAGEAAAAAAAAAVKEGRGKGKEDDGVVDLQTVTVAAPGIDIWNPAFDVTPAALIDAIVTERGVVEKARPDGVFDFGPIFRD